MSRLDEIYAEIDAVSRAYDRGQISLAERQRQISTLREERSTLTQQDRILRNARRQAQQEARAAAGGDVNAAVNTPASRQRAIEIAAGMGVQAATDPRTGDTIRQADVPTPSFTLPQTTGVGAGGVFSDGVSGNSGGVSPPPPNNVRLSQDRNPDFVQNTSTPTASAPTQGAGPRTLPPVGGPPAPTQGAFGGLNLSNFGGFGDLRGRGGIFNPPTNRPITPPATPPQVVNPTWQTSAPPANPTPPPTPGTEVISPGRPGGGSIFQQPAQPKPDFNLQVRAPVDSGYRAGGFSQVRGNTQGAPAIGGPRPAGVFGGV